MMFNRLKITDVTLPKDKSSFYGKKNAASFKVINTKNPSASLNVSCYLAADEMVDGWIQHDYLVVNMKIEDSHDQNPIETSWESYDLQEVNYSAKLKKAAEAFRKSHGKSYKAVFDGLMLLSSKFHERECLERKEFLEKEGKQTEPFRRKLHDFIKGKFR